MGNNEIIKGNKLIAEFMGGKVAYFSITNLAHYRNLPHGRTIVFENLKYNSSWDWLMPVVEKIVNLDTGFSGVTSECFYLKHMMFHEIIGSISTLWNRVIAFIEWYNQKNKL
jgi:hypothetical protein